MKSLFVHYLYSLTFAICNLEMHMNHNLEHNLYHNKHILKCSPNISYCYDYFK